MTPIRRINVDPNLSSTKPKENLTIQDAMVAVALYASQLEPHDCDDDIDKIQFLAQEHPLSLFHEDSESIRSRIYKFANYVGADKSGELVNLAAASLTAKMKKIAFEWAVALSSVDDGSLEKKHDLLDDLRIRLAIDNYDAEKIISKIRSKEKPQ
jgi:hypothetical protein